MTEVRRPVPRRQRDSQGSEPFCHEGASGVRILDRSGNRCSPVSSPGVALPLRPVRDTSFALFKHCQASVST